MKNSVQHQKIVVHRTLTDIFRQEELTVIIIKYFFIPIKSTHGKG